MKAPRFPRSAVGFTMIEVLGVVAAIAVLGSIGYVSITNTQQASAATKLDQDVASLNGSIQLYLSSGGNLTSATTTDAVLTKLKTRADPTKTLGVTGSVIDARIVPDYGDSSSRRRAVWVAAEKRFVVQQGTAGVVEFKLDEDLATTTPTTDASRTTTMGLATTGGWVWNTSPPTTLDGHWDWIDSGGLPGHWVWIPDPPPQGVTPTIGGSTTLGLSDAVNQNFPGGYWTVGPSGIVPVSYVYREAGYASRLALFSLEGMGPDVYNLDTPEGQRDFLMEAIRRIIAGDRAQTIIDASSDKSIGSATNQLQAVNNKQFTFRPGDTVAAIMIPNDTMQNAWNALNALGTLSNSSTALQNLAANSGTKFPLTSLSRTNAATGSNTTFPFYADQYAAVGTGTSAYAIEDTRVAGDGDYQDLLFKATNLTAPDGSFAKTVDPISYFEHWDNPTTTTVENINKLDAVGTNGGMTLRQAMTAAGIIPP
ncbi:MAG: DUF4114 domain-containing protein [Verrucomicrobiae bacterium]